MYEKLQRLFGTVLPYLVLGIAVALILGLFIMLSYVLLWGIMIGGILWAVAAIKKYVASITGKDTPIVKSQKRGRTIEHDHEDQL